MLRILDMQPNQAVERIMALQDQYPWIIDALASIIKDRYKAGFMEACEIANIDPDAAETIFQSLHQEIEM